MNSWLHSLGLAFLLTALPNYIWIVGTIRLRRKERAMADVFGSRPAGYFVWMKTNKGPPMPKKFHPRLLNVAKDTKEYYAAKTLTDPPIPLDEKEWLWSLDKLAAKYPPPVQK